VKPFVVLIQFVGIDKNWRANMKVELESSDIATILESLSYSLQRVRDAQDTPYEVRRMQLDKIEGAQLRLRNAKPDNDQSCVTK
jgi:uncharacterized membrane protein